MCWTAGDTASTTRRRHAHVRGTHCACETSSSARENAKLRARAERAEFLVEIDPAEYVDGAQDIETTERYMHLAPCFG
jgi:protein-disulfide isomerase-like protein with CxxC motif